MAVAVTFSVATVVSLLGLVSVCRRCVRAGFVGAVRSGCECPVFFVGMIGAGMRVHVI